MNVDPDKFIRVWKESDSVAEVAKKMEMTSPGMAKTYAWFLRSLGYDLPLKKTGRKPKDAKVNK